MRVLMLLVSVLVLLVLTLPVHAQQYDPTQPYMDAFFEFASFDHRTASQEFLDPPDNTMSLADLGWTDFDLIMIPVQANVPVGSPYIGSWLEAWVESPTVWHQVASEPMQAGLKNYFLGFSPGGGASSTVPHSLNGYDVHVYFVNPANDIELSESAHIPHVERGP